MPSVVIVDEIGKMELFSKPFMKAVIELFESQASILATVPVARQHSIQIVEQLKQREDVTLVEVILISGWVMTVVYSIQIISFSLNFLIQIFLT